MAHPRHLRTALTLATSLVVGAGCSDARSTPAGVGVTSADASAPDSSVNVPGSGPIPARDSGVRVPGAMPGAEAGAAGAPDSSAGTPDVNDAGGGLAAGSLDVTWMHGAANCGASTDPELQVHSYNATTYVIRQDKCRTFEAPFVYLLLGADTALLLDTGATNGPGLRDAVVPLIGARALIVAHTHAHGDHVASDAQFAGQPATTVIGTSVAAVQAGLGIEPWPTGTAEVDLGARVLDVLGIPGHEQAHIAIYDRETGLLLTGDSLYPGLLFINDWTTYRTSVRRMAEFVAAHPVAHVLGAHIEMTSTPGVSYPYGTIYQPEEHVLQLRAEHVLELDAALEELGPTPPSGPVARADFVIDPQ